MGKGSSGVFIFYSKKLITINSMNNISRGEKSRNISQKRMVLGMLFALIGLLFLFFAYHVTEGRNSMSTANSAAGVQRARPAIDLAAPVKFETATFSLG